jgi:hypothetical protein
MYYENCKEGSIGFAISAFYKGQSVRREKEEMSLTADYF